MTTLVDISTLPGFKTGDTLVRDPHGSGAYTLFRPHPGPGEMEIIVHDAGEITRVSIPLDMFPQVCTAFALCAIAARDKHGHILG